MSGNDREFSGTSQDFGHGDTPPAFAAAAAPIEGSTVNATIRAIDPITGTLTGFRYSGRSDVHGNQVFYQVSPYDHTMVNRTAFIGPPDDNGALTASYVNPERISWPSPQHQDPQAQTIGSAGAPSNARVTGLPQQRAGRPRSSSRTQTHSDQPNRGQSRSRWERE
jgi:hypothetical protein